MADILQSAAIFGRVGWYCRHVCSAPRTLVFRKEVAGRGRGGVEGRGGGGVFQFKEVVL